MTRPRILLIPEFTELEWAIKPRLEEWAEVASYDPPGVGVEPPADQLDREAIVARGLLELDRRGWDRCFVASDGWGIATAVLLSLARADAVAGLALGHTKLSYRREGERAPSTPRSGRRMGEAPLSSEVFADALREFCGAIPSGGI